MGDLRSSEMKVDELIGQIMSKLDTTEGAAMSEGSLRQVRQKAAQLSETVAGVERMSSAQSKAGPGKLSGPHRDVHKELADQVVQLKRSKGTGATGRRWVVVGGANTGGINVQSGSQVLSEDLEERLATGAMIEQIDMQDGKVLFQKINGDGPMCGWATVAFDGAPLLVEAVETELE